jgi:ribosome-binding protein aMBF1 (putative translation factor)
MNDSQSWAATLTDTSSGDSPAILGDSQNHHPIESDPMNPARRGPDTSTYVGRVAAHIRKLREKAGLTVPELAEKISNASGEDITAAAVYAWESGRQSPKIKTLPHIATAVGVAKVRNVLPPE